MDIDLLAVRLHPYYLPREFTGAFLVVVYTLPAVATDTLCDVMSVVARLQTQRPNVF